MLVFATCNRHESVVIKHCTKKNKNKKNLFKKTSENISASYIASIIVLPVYNTNQVVEEFLLTVFCVKILTLIKIKKKQ